MYMTVRGCDCVNYFFSVSEIETCLSLCLSIYSVILIRKTKYMIVLIILCFFLVSEIETCLSLCPSVVSS